MMIKTTTTCRRAAAVLLLLAPAAACAVPGYRATSTSSMAAKRFTRIDPKGDGMLDKAEIDAMLARKFRKLDANGDGVVGADERAAAHGKKGTAASGGSDT